MANRYLLAELPAMGRAELSGDLAHHLGRVLRVQPGQQIRLGDGRGGTADARVLDVGRRTITVEVGPSSHQPATRPRITLAFACPRPARADWLIEHATEVGVTAFQPLWCERSRPQSLRIDRWRKIAAAAVGQCDRAWAPDICDATEMTGWLAGPLPTRRLLASAAGSEVPRQSPTHRTPRCWSARRAVSPPPKSSSHASTASRLRVSVHMCCAPRPPRSSAQPCC